MTDEADAQRIPAATVDLPTYAVTIARGALASLGDVVRATAAAHRYAIVTDSNVGPRYAPLAKQLLGIRCSVYTVPAGEAHKTRDSWATLTDALLADGFGRDSTLVALGGGVVGDLAGFVAATYMRGVPYVQVPTTLLAMIDASVGGKTGVDTATGKNLVGAFHNPAAVIADPDLLSTLPTAHLRSGLAEALKHGVIADADYFDLVIDAGPALVDGSLDSATAISLIAGSVNTKAAIVRRDEREGGIRKILNFGHTLGHAIELGSGFRMLHGEAVAIGMVLESALAESVGIADPGTWPRIQSAVRRLGLPDALPRDQAPAQILAATGRDKKARKGYVEYTLPARIGTMAAADRGWAVPVADDAVLRVLT